MHHPKTKARAMINRASTNEEVETLDCFTLTLFNHAAGLVPYGLGLGFRV